MGYSNFWVPTFDCTDHKNFFNCKGGNMEILNKSVCFFVDLKFKKLTNAPTN